ncbi:MAG TPA: 4Fe-4S double cluster binding domain-containing protein, partial [Spirochaetia bacterium]
RNRGYRVATGSAELIGEVRASIRTRRDRGELDRRFAGAWLGWLDAPAGTNARSSVVSVLAVAVPSPACRVRFALDTGTLTAVIPPTYSEDTGADERLMDDLAASFPLLRGALRPVYSGRKALAVKLGLAAYGVNNITYTPGLGSLVRLAAFESAVALPATRGERASVTGQLDECESCGHCRDACPTGAISGDRFLLRAERCLTSVNERPGPWPSWIPASAHNCLVGCMVCQEICPRNDGLLSVRDTGVEFTREETRALLGGAWESTAVADAIRARLAGIGLDGYADVIGRNLAALVSVRR